jgi:hypothetical protein
MPPFPQVGPVGGIKDFDCGLEFRAVPLLLDLAASRHRDHGGESRAFRDFVL